jgi:hypothetical protein
MAPASALLEVINPSAGEAGSGSVLGSAVWAFDGPSALGGSVLGRLRGTPIP